MREFITDRKLLKTTKIVQACKDLTKELLLRIAHNQYRINSSKDMIKILLQTRYDAAYSEIPQLISNMVRFSKQRKIHNSFDIDEENKLACDVSILNTDLLNELEESTIIWSYTDVVPGPEVMSAEMNAKYRSLIDSTIKNKNDYHDYNIT